MAIKGNKMKVRLIGVLSVVILGAVFGLLTYMFLTGGDLVERAKEATTGMNILTCVFVPGIMGVMGCVILGTLSLAPAWVILELGDSEFAKLTVHCGGLVGAVVGAVVSTTILVVMIGFAKPLPDTVDGMPTTYLALIVGMFVSAATACFYIVIRDKSWTP